MITGGVGVTINVLEEQMFGPLVLFGLAGAAYVLADRAARLAPLTDADADDLIRSGRAAPRLLGRLGAAGAGIGSLKDMLLRVPQMADDLPQITELDLSPVIARADDAVAVDARVASSPRNPPTPTCADCGSSGKPTMGLILLEQWPGLAVSPAPTMRRRSRRRALRTASCSPMPLRPHACRDGTPLLAGRTVRGSTAGPARTPARRSRPA